MRVKLPYEFGFSSVEIAVEELMKFLAVVHFREVGYLVAYHIVAQLGRKEQHGFGDAYGAVGAAASQCAPAVAYQPLPRRGADAFGQFTGARQQ